ncbi:MAG: hypothetical protein K2H06_00785, partial [Anaeroplasmataceae bacterium]|nr:hypothetical protein [Anaeroplasmataceae bacterium]
LMSYRVFYRAFCLTLDTLNIIMRVKRCGFMTKLYTFNKKDKRLYILSIWIFGILISVSLLLLFFLLGLLSDEEVFGWAMILPFVFSIYSTLVLFVYILMPVFIIHLESYIDEGKIYITKGKEKLEFSLEDIQVKVHKFPLCFVGKTSIAIISQMMNNRNKRNHYKGISLVTVCSKKRAMEIVDLIEKEKRKLERL